MLPFTPARTIGGNGARAGVVSGRPYLRWPRSGPLQQPDSYLDYTYSADGETMCGADPLVSVSVSVSPSGAGETAASAISVNGSTITVWMNGGVAGRWYLVRIEMTTQAGRKFSVLIGFPIDRSLALNPLPTPPDSGFGAALTWPTSIAFALLGADGAVLLGADGAVLTYSLPPLFLTGADGAILLGADNLQLTSA
jgi:hypothetical protein